MRALIAAFALLLSFASIATAQELLSPTEFREAAMSALRVADPQAEVQAGDALYVDVDYPNDPSRMGSRVSLEHAYSQYQANPAAMGQVIHNWIAFMLMPDVTMTTEGLISVLVSRSSIERFMAESAAARERSGRAPSSLVWRPFVGDLVEAMAFYENQGVRLAVYESLSGIGSTPEQAWAAIPQNLRSRFGAFSARAVPNSTRLVYLREANGLAPSALIIGAVCETRARFAFLVVDPEGFVAGDRDDPAAMSELRTLLDNLRRSGRSMSLTPLGCLDGRVVEIALTD